MNTTTAMKHIALALVVLLIVAIGTATFLGHKCGMARAYATVYGSAWFTVLWAFLLIAGSVCAVQRKLYHRKPEMLLHVSFATILVGAFVTSLTARRGTLSLNKGDEMTMYESDVSGGAFFGEPAEVFADMPVSLRLLGFEVKYYEGTRTPSDFVSRVLLKDKKTGQTRRITISMNKILRYKGYRFCQSSYNPTTGCSRLTVCFDPWGIGITYMGYALLAVAFAWVVVNPRGRFRHLCRNNIFRTIACVPLLFGGCLTASAAAPPTLHDSETEALAHLQVLYNGRIAPLQTLAVDFTTKLTGTPSYEGLSAMQVLSGWMFFPHAWENEPMIKMKRVAALGRMNIGSRARFTDFFTPEGNYMLNSYWATSRQGEDCDAEAVWQADEKIQLISMLRSRAVLKMFPYTQGGLTVWYAPCDSLPCTMPPTTRAFIHHAMDLLSVAVTSHNVRQTCWILNRFIRYQQNNGGHRVFPRREWKWKSSTTEFLLLQSSTG